MKEKIKRSLEKSKLFIPYVVMGCTTMIAYKLGCQKGVNTVHDVIRRHDQELFEKVDTLIREVSK